MTKHIVRRLLDDKHALADRLADPAWAPVWDELAGEFSTGWTRKPSGAVLTARWGRSLGISEDFAVSRELCVVLTQAAMDLPDDYIAEHHHLFAEHGFVWLEEPITDEVHQGRVGVMTWHHGTGWSDRKPGGPGVVPGIEINLWSRNPQGYLLPAGSDFLPYGMKSSGWGGIVPNVDHTLSLATRFVLAMQMFMRQELPARTDFPYPRSLRPHLRRMQWPERHITVIDLRRRKHVPRETEGESGRHVGVRFVVRGHWARYWVGPSHPLHSRETDGKEVVHIYRHPHLRGPEDGPLAMTDRVNVVRR
jgi:hypothetical protein